MEQRIQSMQNNSHENDLSLKDLIEKVLELFEEIKKNWKLILKIAVPFVLLFLIQNFFQPPIYKASLTFMVNEEGSGGGMSGVSSILGQFGLGGGAGTAYNLDKILRLSKSRKIVQMALFEKYLLNNQLDYIANHLIREYEYHELWEDDTTGLKNFFFTHDEINTFNRVENKALLELHKKVVGGEDTEGIAVSSYEEETGVMHLATKSTSEQLSIVLTNSVYEKLSSFYVEKSIERQKQTFEVLKLKADSIQGVLNSVSKRLLQLKDKSRGVILKQYESDEIQLEIETQKLLVAYGEAYKNQELAEFALKNQTPFVQIIDAPIAPIVPDKMSIIVSFIIGSIVGGFIAVLYIIGRKILGDIMAG